VRGKKPSPWVGPPLVGIGTLLVLAALFGIGRPAIEKWLTQLALSQPTQSPTAIPPTVTPEPLIPTRTLTAAAEMETETPTASAEPTEETKATATTEPTATPHPPTATPHPPTPPPTQVAAPSSTDLWRGRPRWGVGAMPRSVITQYDIAPLHLGWYLDWNMNPDPLQPGGVEYAQMVRLKGGTLNASPETLTAAAQSNPGSLWLVSNEPDSFMQDYVEPSTYARLYHEAYTAIKTADPTAQVAIGGVVQPTPLRLRYIEAILAEYREQFGTEAPMDAWHVHNFILREEQGTWGAFIPPGLPDEQGTLYEIDDSGNLDAFRQQVVDFRRWMAERGYQNYPLIVSEYGIPMPEDYGFPPERVVAFLWATFDFFSTARDPTSGYPEDDYRLVQRWCWYSLNAPDGSYPQGRLFDPATGQMTAVGLGWEEYVNEH
jgi:hypothetical protein